MSKPNSTKFFIILLTIFTTIQTGLFAQQSERRSLIPSEKFHLAISGFGGPNYHLKEQYSNIFDHSYFPFYGFGIQSQITDRFWLQLTTRFSSYDNSHSARSNRSDGNWNRVDYIASFKLRTYALSAMVYPIRFILHLNMTPYIKVGVSLNDYKIRGEYTKVITSINDEIVETQGMIFIPHSNDNKKYRLGYGVAAGIVLDPQASVPFFFEIQYNAIMSDIYKGGLLLQGGVIFNIT